MSDRFHGAQVTCPVALDRTSKTWQALRPGPVYDIDTGAHLIDLDPASIVRDRDTLALMQSKGIPIPIDYGHAIQRTRTGEPVKTYGKIVDAAIDDDGRLVVTPDLTEAGRALLDGSEGAYWLSPAYGAGPLHDPETGERLADRYIESITITPTPRQNRLEGISLSKGSTSPAMLARFNNDREAKAFHEALQAAVADTVRRTHGHSPNYISIRMWEGDESGTVGASYWTDEPEMSWLWLMDWTRDESGTVTASNPRMAEERIVFEPKDDTEQAARAVSLSKEVGMALQTVDVTALVARLGNGAELSKTSPVTIEVPAEAAKVLEGAIELSRQQTKALDEAKGAAQAAEARAIKAEAQAEAAAGDSIQLAKAEERIAALEAKQAEAEAKAAELAKAQEAAEQVDALVGDGSVHLSKRAKWLERAVSLGREGFDALVSDLRDDGTLRAGKHAPMVLDRGAGANVGQPDGKAQAALAESKIIELAKAEGITRIDAVRRLMKTGGAA